MLFCVLVLYKARFSLVYTVVHTLCVIPIGRGGGGETESDSQSRFVCGGGGCVCVTGRKEGGKRAVAKRHDAATRTIYSSTRDDARVGWEGGGKVGGKIPRNTRKKRGSVCVGGYLFYVSRGKGKVRR